MTVVYKIAVQIFLLQDRWLTRSTHVSAVVALKWFRSVGEAMVLAFRCLSLGFCFLFVC